MGPKKKNTPLEEDIDFTQYIKKINKGLEDIEKKIAKGYTDLHKKSIILTKNLMHP